MCLSFSFEELHEHLHMDRAWITPVAVLSNTVKEIEGGWSRMLADFLELQVLGAQGLRHGGVPLKIGGEHRLLYARVGTLLSDGDGLRLALQWAGANGVRPCFRHPNVLSKHGDREAPGYVTIACADASQFELWTQEGARAMARDVVAAREDVSAGRRRKAYLETLQKAWGFSVTADGLLARQALQDEVSLTHTVRFDWVHTLLADGSLQASAWLLIEMCEKLQVAKQTDLSEFLQSGWHVPRSARYGARDVRKLHTLFTQVAARANTKHGKIRCNASELLALYGLLQHWVEVAVPDDPRLGHARECFRKSCAAVDLILQVKRRRVRGAEVSQEVTELLEEHLALLIHCHGLEHVKPKHHWGFDVAEQLATCGHHLMDAFIVERLHLRARAVADYVGNTAVFDQAVCAGILNSHSLSLRSPSSSGDGLVGPISIADVGDLRQAHVSDALRDAGKYLEVDAMVLTSSGCAGQVRACVAAGATFYVVAAPMRPTRPRTGRAIHCLPSNGEHELWPARDVEQCLAWQRSEAGEYTLIAP